jgi:hypothetical protein
MAESEKKLYKLRYIKAVMCKQINSIYWLKKTNFCRVNLGCVGGIAAMM